MFLHYKIDNWLAMELKTPQDMLFIEAWIQPLSATLGVEDFRRCFKSETLSRTGVKPRFDFC